MVVYVNGCSHSDDLWQEKDEERNGSFVWSYHLIKKLSEDFNYYRIESESLKKRPYIIGEKSFNFPISNLSHINYDILINDSVSGSGNDRILHVSLESINKLIKSNKKPTLVVIQWSGVSRREYCNVDGTPLFVTPMDNPHLFPKFEPMATTHTAHYIFILQEFLKKYNIDYYFFTYMGVDKLIKNLNIYNSLDFDRIIDFGNDTFYNGLLDLLIENNFNRDEHGHPNERGAKFISDIIFNKI